MPSNAIVPRVGAYSPTISRATVDLPQPDSPTSASVSPRAIVEGRRRRPRAAARAACARCTRFEPGRRDVEVARDVGNCDAAAARLRHARQLASQPAGGAAGADRRRSSGRSRRQRSKRLRAARMERAARRDRVEPRHRAVDLHQPLALAAPSVGIEPIRPDRVGMLRRGGSRRATGPISTMRPAYITATRSAVSAITPMSWVISITAVPCSRREPLQQLR